ncbi:hypothetical protein MAR_026924, partial [Mya arenaria]
MANARTKAEQADQSAMKAEQDSDTARLKAKEFAPEFHQPGTDIIKKKLMEQNHNGGSPDEVYDFSHYDMQQNHNPHQRSKSLMMRDGPGGGMSPMFDQDPNRKISAQADFNYLSVNNPLLQTPNSLNPSQETVISNHSPHNRSPSLKIRRYSFLAGSQRGRGFSELFNSTILNDHFDQYSAQRDDSGLGREFLTHEDRIVSNTAHPSDTSPDSGVSEGVNDSSRPFVRRRTLPCIVNQDDPDKEAKAAVKEQAHSSENLSGKNPDRYIIENGIRKRVKGVTRNPQRISSKPSSSKGDLPKEYEIESQNALSRGGKHGSLPDITAIQKTDKSPISRQEAYKLSTARREELRRLQDIAERRRQGDVTVILGDLRDFVQQRQLLVLVIALNLSLAT